jgi:hypothetical protein
MVEFGKHERPFTVVYDKKEDKYEILHVSHRRLRMGGDGVSLKYVDHTKYLIWQNPKKLLELAGRLVAISEFIEDYRLDDQTTEREE